ncbi:archaetidylserine decarboxylase [uncultured Oxalicibacterium sp.]|uniref:archaetidylserine decarboxylase n=1 Tax=uncultured Oxalicibacterium sp. TaxID=1168540 RepID=UPI0025DF3724|nr:archaetidylserine decarboxylase [uncultured Oxalicibacterium sp.]
MFTRLSVIPQYFLPKKALTAFAGLVAGAEAGRITTGLIRWFIGKYQVNMSEAANPDIHSYATFNDFFTRALRPGARPQADADFLSPVDGAISQFGKIHDDLIFQAKGHNYLTTALVGGDQALAEQFRHGSFATLYLSPRDYHRVHMPCDGRLMRMIYVPGALFSVNPTTARGVPNLFARNERVVCVFDSVHGPFVMVLVGATIVGSMQTVWHGVINPPRTGQVREWRYDKQHLVLKKGEEMGRFLLGSTVVLLFQKDKLAFEQSWQSTGAIKVGERMADLVVSDTQVVS